MKRGFLIARHIVTALIALCILLTLIYFSIPEILKVLDNPKFYLNLDWSPAEVQRATIYLLTVLSSVLFSYVIYLLLLSQTRAEYMTFTQTKSLENSLEWLEQLYLEAPVPYIILNHVGEISHPNKAALRFFGGASKDIEGKNLFEFMTEKDQKQEQAEKIKKYFESNLPIDREEIKLIFKDGQTKWVSLSIFKTSNCGKNRHQSLATLFDITEQKRLDQAKTEFVSLASHQLHSPTATMKWYLEMLLSGNLGSFDPKQQAYLETIEKINKEMINVVDALLNVSRIEAGSLKVENRPTNAIELCESILLELQSQIVAKQLNIEKRYDNYFRDIESDPKLLRIAIQNLVSNAIKYTPFGGTITLQFKSSFLEKTISVSDTGSGIPFEEQGKVFTKLFRASNIRHLEKVSGTGLGLYLVKSIVEILGGSVTFSSEEGKGSTFIIKF